VARKIARREAFPMPDGSSLALAYDFVPTPNPILASAMQYPAAAG
jgi:hypothetical protein